MAVTYFELRSETVDGDHPNTTEKPVNNTGLANAYYLKYENRTVSHTLSFRRRNVTRSSVWCLNVICRNVPGCWRFSCALSVYNLEAKYISTTCFPEIYFIFLFFCLTLLPYIVLNNIIHHSVCVNLTS